MTSPRPHRYYVRSPDGSTIFGLEIEKAAEVAAVEYGDGAVVA